MDGCTVLRQIFGCIVYLFSRASRKYLTLYMCVYALVHAFVCCVCVFFMYFIYNLCIHIYTYLYPRMKRAYFVYRR